MSSLFVLFAAIALSACGKGRGGWLIGSASMIHIENGSMETEDRQGEKRAEMRVGRKEDIL